MSIRRAGTRTNAECSGQGREIAASVARTILTPPLKKCAHRALRRAFRGTDLRRRASALPHYGLVVVPSLPKVESNGRVALFSV